MNDIIFVGNGRDYHAIDWYRTVKNICKNRKVLFATDLIDSEGYQIIVNENDNLINIYNIDWLLSNNQSVSGNIWRNIVKALVYPIQVRHIKRIEKAQPDAIFHAHTMYYMFLSWAAGISYIGTPQGSEILVRPNKSKIYKYFACKALSAADHIIVDSVNLQNRIRELCGKEAVVIQNGIDASLIRARINDRIERSGVHSLRGMCPIYRIEAILAGRANSKLKPLLSFTYPFWEEEYKRVIRSRLDPRDLDLGRLPSKDDMYELLSSTVLAISIPKSDSSPRSVYEAIFCGCCVAVTYNPWIENLPSCMRSRLFIVELEDEAWFDKAYEFARLITKEPFVPSQAALDLFDQERSIGKVVDLFYNNRKGKCDENSDYRC